MLRKHLGYFFTAILVFSCGLATVSASDKSEKKTKPTVGRVEVTTTPAGYPLIIDGTQMGQTSNPASPVDLTPGRHTVEVIFPNGRRFTQQVNVIAGKRHCICLEYRPRPAKLPCLTPITITGPSIANEGELVTFATEVTYHGTGQLTYTWTVTPAQARIVSGQGTPSITVDTTGLGKQRVSAILVVDDGSGDRLCRQAAQISIGVLSPPPPPVTQLKRFDEFPSLAYDDVKARLDNLAIDLQNQPAAQGYIIAYSGRTSRIGQSDRLAARARNYLINTRGIDPSRLVVTNGGYRERDYFELWVVPQGAQPPQATPTLKASEVSQPPVAQRGTTTAATTHQLRGSNSNPRVRRAHSRRALRQHHH
jgi:hypothetical protein